MNEYFIFKLLCQEREVKFPSQRISQHWFRKFKDKGLDVILLGKLLKLAMPMIALDNNEISTYLDKKDKYISKQIKIVYETSSTNAEIRENKSADILLSEYQSTGKGRRGKSWVSPVGHNIYLSLKYNNQTNKNLSFLPIYVSLLLAKSLTKLGIEGVSIKWPNDLYLYNKKFSGSILESFVSLSKDNGASNILILGIGINVTMPVVDNKIIDQPYTSISQQHTNNLCNRNYLLASFLPKLCNCLDTFDTGNIGKYIEEFNAFNILKNQELMISETNQKFKAKYISLNKDGSLKVRKGDEVMDLYAAEVSIKFRDF